MSKSKSLSEAQKAAARERARAWVANNPEKARARNAAYYAANRDKVRARRAAYYAANRDKVRARTKARYVAKRDEALAYQVAWRAANRDKVRANKAAYYIANRDAYLERARAQTRASLAENSQDIPYLVEEADRLEAIGNVERCREFAETITYDQAWVSDRLEDFVVKWLEELD